MADLPRAIEPRRLDHMVSVRLDPDLVCALREMATKRKVTISDLLRDGAWRLLLEDAMRLNDGRDDGA